MLLVFFFYLIDEVFHCFELVANCAIIRYIILSAFSLEYLNTLPIFFKENTTINT